MITMNRTLRIALLAFLLAIGLALVYRNPLMKAFDRLRGINPQEEAVRELSRLRSTSVKDISNPNGIAGEAIVLARRASIATTTVQISSCQASPSVIKLKYGEKFAFQNVGDTIASLALPNLKMGLEPHQSLSVRTTDIAQASKGKEAYTLVIYTCAGKEGPAGYIYIVY
jgi:hypothetical protein